MADGDGVARPIHLPLWTTFNKAKIDKADLGPREMPDQIVPNAGMEAPAMDEDKAHHPRSAKRAAR